MLAVVNLRDFGLSRLTGRRFRCISTVVVRGAGKLHDISNLQVQRRSCASGGRSAGCNGRLHSVSVTVEFTGVNPPVVGALTAESLDIAIQTNILGAGRVIDTNLAVLPPEHDEMASSGPEPLQHKSNEVVTLFEHLLHFLMIGVIGLSIDLGPVQHIAVNAELGKLRLEIAVIGAIAQGLITMGHRPVTCVFRSELLPGDGFDQHGRSSGAASGTADSCVFALHPIGLVLPPAVRLQIGNRFFVHRIILSNSTFFSEQH